MAANTLWLGTSRKRESWDTAFPSPRKWLLLFSHRLSGSNTITCLKKIPRSGFFPLPKTREVITPNVSSTEIPLLIGTFLGPWRALRESIRFEMRREIYFISSCTHSDILSNWLGG